MGRSPIGLYMVGFDLDLEGHLGSKLSKSTENRLVCTITFEGLKVLLPNLGIRCIMGRSRLGLYIVGFDSEGLKLVSPILAIWWIMGRSRMGFYMVGFDEDLHGHFGSNYQNLLKTGLSAQ